MEKGRVIKVDGHKITVRLLAKEACKKCGVCSVDKMGQAILEDADNTVNAKEGDTVLIENNGSSMVLAAFIIYVMPLMFLLGGYFLSFYLTKTFSLATYFTYLGTLFSFVLSLVIIWFIDKYIAKLASFKPVVVKKL